MNDLPQSPPLEYEGIGTPDPHEHFPQSDFDIIRPTSVHSKRERIDDLPIMDRFHLDEFDRQMLILEMSLKGKINDKKMADVLHVTTELIESRRYRNVYQGSLQKMMEPSILKYLRCRDTAIEQLEMMLLSSEPMDPVKAKVALELTGSVRDWLAAVDQHNAQRHIRGIGKQPLVIGDVADEGADDGESGGPGESSDTVTIRLLAPPPPTPPAPPPELVKIENEMLQNEKGISQVVTP